MEITFVNNASEINMKWSIHSSVNQTIFNNQVLLFQILFLNHPFAYYRFLPTIDGFTTRKQQRCQELLKKYAIIIISVNTFSWYDP